MSRRVNLIAADSSKPARNRGWAAGRLLSARELETGSRPQIGTETECLDAHGHRRQRHAMIHKSEMGQGSVTSLSSFSPRNSIATGAIRTEFAPVDPASGCAGRVRQPEYPHLLGSAAQAGATAREMLMDAAAQKWGMDKSQCRAENSYVINTATNARLSYGNLAEPRRNCRARECHAEDPKQFRLIGTSPKRLDTR